MGAITTKLLECPYNMAAGFLTSEWAKREIRGNCNAMYDLVSESTTQHFCHENALYEKWVTGLTTLKRWKLCTISWRMAIREFLIIFCFFLFCCFFFGGCVLKPPHTCYSLYLNSSFYLNISLIYFIQTLAQILPLKKVFVDSLPSKVVPKSLSTSQVPSIIIWYYSVHLTGISL